MTIKHKIYGLLEEHNTRAGRLFELLIVVLIWLSVLEIILESYEHIERSYREWFSFFELFTVVIFSAEYLGRIWTADLKFPNLSPTRARLKFMTSAIGLIDLLAILPFFLPLLFRFDLRFIRVLRLFRLLRIFKMNRYTKALRLVAEVFNDKWRELSLTIFVTLILMLVSSTIMYNIERDLQPDQFPNIVQTFWWSLATLTTIGYGDVVPISGWGKIISGIIALLGIGLVALPTGILSAAFIDKLAHRHHTCPHCGEHLAHSHEPSTE